MFLTCSPPGTASAHHLLGSRNNIASLTLGTRTLLAGAGLLAVDIITFRAHLQIWYLISWVTASCKHNKSISQLRLFFITKHIKKHQHVLNTKTTNLFLDHKFHPDRSRDHKGFGDLDRGNVSCILWHSVHKTVHHNQQGICTVLPRQQGCRDPVWLTPERHHPDNHVLLWKQIYSYFILYYVVCACFWQYMQLSDTLSEWKD